MKTIEKRIFMLLLTFAIMCSGVGINDISAQEIPCPTIEIKSQPSIYAGYVIPFTVVLSKLDPNDTPTYNWSISSESGFIGSGQGTSRIFVEDTKNLAGKGLTAKVEVYAGVCTLSASKEIKIVPNNAPVLIEYIEEYDYLKRGKVNQVRFRITDAKTGKNKDDLKSIGVSASDTFDEKWKFQTEAKFVGDGVYEFEFTPPEFSRTYTFTLQIKSLNINFQDSPIKIARSTGF